MLFAWSYSLDFFKLVTWKEKAMAACLQAFPWELINVTAEANKCCNGIPVFTLALRFHRFYTSFNMCMLEMVTSDLIRMHPWNGCDSAYSYFLALVLLSYPQNLKVNLIQCRFNLMVKDILSYQRRLKLFNTNTCHTHSEIYFRYHYCF